MHFHMEVSQSVCHTLAQPAWISDIKRQKPKGLDNTKVIGWVIYCAQHAPLNQKMVDIRVLCSLYVSNQNSVFVMSVKQVSILPKKNVYGYVFFQHVFFF